MSTNDLILRYSGNGAEDSSIDIKELIMGLNGLVKITGIIMHEYDSENTLKSSLEIKGFQKGSFEVILAFVESRSVLMKSATDVLVAVIEGLAYYFTHREKSGNLNDESSYGSEIDRIIATIINSPEKREAAQKSLYAMAYPLLLAKKMEAVDFGMKTNPKRLMDESNVHCFAGKKSADLFRERIELQGQIISLNKRTLNGKFMDLDNKTYSISLEMSDYYNYFHYFNQKIITIYGVAVYKKEESRIKKIKVSMIKN